jgi:hypothetical protein
MLYPGPPALRENDSISSLALSDEAAAAERKRRGRTGPEKHE